MENNINVLLQTLGKTNLTTKHGSPLSLVVADPIIGTGDEFERVTDDVAAVLGKELAFYREDILGRVKSISLDVTKQVNAKKENLLPEIPELVTVTIPKFIDTLIDRNTHIESPKGFLPENDIYIPLPADTGKYDTLDGDMILKTQSDEFSSRITTSEVERIWNTYIASPGTANRDISGLLTLTGRNSKTVNDVFMVYILLVNIGENTPPGTTGDLNSFRSVINIYKRLVFGAIRELVAQYRGCVNRKMVVMTYGRSCTFLNKNVLDSYYKENLELDALLSAAHSKEKHIQTIDQFKDAHSVLLDKWAKVSLNARNEAKSKSVAFYKNVYFSTFSKIVSTSDLPYMKHTPQEAFAAFREHLSKLSPLEIMNPTQVVESVFVDVLFGNTNVKKFLGYVRLYGTDNDMSTSIELATMEMIGDYLLTQIEAVE